MRCDVLWTNGRFCGYSKTNEIKKVYSSHKRILVYGVGASLISQGDTYIYCDMARWGNSMSISSRDAKT